MGDERVEFVVVGAGVVGLSAARALARRGRHVLVCERAEVGHERSGSKGSARIFRLGYDDPDYVRMAMAARRLWTELEAETGELLLRPTGQVTFGADLGVLVAAMAEAGAPYEEAPGPELSARFPGLQVSGPAVFEPASAVMAASACLAALRRTAEFEVREATGVLSVADGRRVGLLLEGPDGRRRVEATAVVVCAGPATAPLVGAGFGLRPRPTLEQVAYLGPADGAPAPTVPVFVERGHPWFYGLPVADGETVKVSLHGAGPALDPLRPDGLGQEDDDPALLARLLDAARRRLRGLSLAPRRTERCVYDNAPSGRFVLDRRGGVVVGTGTSGHGFKFGPLLGERLADLATGVSPGSGAPSRYSGDVR